MRIYLVSVNGKPYEQMRASRAAVAVHRAMDRLRDTDLDGATITVRRGEKIKYGYRVMADVPCEPAGSMKREAVTGTLATRPEAVREYRLMLEAHPEYKFIRIRRVEVQ